MLHASHVDTTVGAHTQGTHALHDTPRLARVADEQVDDFLAPLPLDDGIQVVAPPPHPARDEALHRLRLLLREGALDNATATLARRHFPRLLPPGQPACVLAFDDL